MEKLPFVETKNNTMKKRVFSNDVDDSELKWHFDEEDRKVKILESDGWQIQMDDELPKTLIPNETIFIPKNVYHRVIKGNGNLVVLIKEITDQDNEFENLIRTFVNRRPNNLGDNFIGVEPVIYDTDYGRKGIKLIGVFNEHYTLDSSDAAMKHTRKLCEQLKISFPFMRDWEISGGSTTTKETLHLSVNPLKNPIF